MKQLKDFKNAIVYKTKPGFVFTPEMLALFEQEAEDSHFDGVAMRDGVLRQDCFVRPVNDKFIYTVNNKIHHIRFKKVNRQIPASVIKREVKKRVDEYFKKEGKSATKNMKAEMKHDVIDDLSSTAFKIDTYVDVLFTNDFVIVGAGSASVADDITAGMRKLFGTLKIAPIGSLTKGFMSNRVTEDINAALTNEESEEVKTLGFDVGDAVSLQGNGQWGGKDISIDSGVVLAGLSAGMSIGKVQLYCEAMHFDIDEDLHLKGIKYSLMLQLSAENSEDEIDGNMIIAYDAITGATNKIAEGLGGWREDDKES